MNKNAKLSTIGETEPEVPTPPDGFFRHHGLWAPGIRLFRRLDFRSKALLISLLFMVPIALLGALYIQHSAAELRLKERQAMGLAHARELLPLVDALQTQRHRQLVDGAADPALATEVAARLRKLEALQAAQGQGLGSTGAFDVLRGNVEKAAKGGGSALASVKRQTQAIDAGLGLLDALVDGSGLSVDPDFSATLLIQVGLGQLPRITESALASADLAIAAARGAPAPAVVGMLQPQRAVGAYVDGQVRLALDKLIQHHPELAQRLAYASTQESLGRLSELAGVVGEEGTTPDAAALAAARAAMVERSAVLLAAVLDELAAAHARAVEGTQVQRLTLGGVLLASLLAVAYLFTAFSRVMSGGLEEVRRHLRALTEGDLTTTPRPWGRDEAARLMLSLHEMQDSLRQIVLQVRRSSHDIGDASRDIAGGAGELSARSGQAATSLQRSAASIEQIGVNARQTADHAGEASEIGRVNLDAAARGGAVFGDVIRTMQDIHASSNRIGEIIGVIDGIAFQTNILALNAAVEAARAGDAGRGFAVVAAEVRSLAQRSASAAREIKSLVGASVDQVRVGTGVVTQAGSVIEEIVDASRRVDALLRGIAGGTREQAVGVTEVGRSVTELDSVTQRNTELVKVTAEAASALHRQAGVLAERVARFRLGSASDQREPHAVDG